MFESLHIKSISRSYTEDMIIYIFWKYGLGKVYRVDFEENMDCDFEFQNAFLYKDEACNWDDELIKSLEQTSEYILNHTTFHGEKVQWTIYKNLNPIPRANTKKNIHQLCHANCELNARIQELENEIKVLKLNIET